MAGGGGGGMRLPVAAFGMKFLQEKTKGMALLWWLASLVWNRTGVKGI